MPGLRRRPVLQRPRRIFLPISLLALLLAAPILVVLTAPLHSDAPQWDHVLHALLPAHLKETVLLLSGVLAISLLIAIPSAWLVASYQFPLRGLLRWAMVLPLAMPTYISAFTYAALLGPTGSMSTWMAGHFGFRPDIVNLPGLSLVLALVLFPYIYLPARAAFSRGMSSQLDAARMLGVAGGQCFRRIALPLARPAIVGGALLAAMETLNDYGAVKYYGVRTLTTGIFRSWGGLYDLGSALRLAMVLLGLVALLLFLERHWRQGARQTTDQVPTQLIQLKGLKGLLTTAWFLLVLASATLLPLGKIIADVLGSWDQGIREELLPAFANTLRVAVIAAGTTLAIAILFTFRERYGRRSDLAV